MSAIWWGREFLTPRRARLKSSENQAPPQPELLPSSRREVIAELRDRIQHFVPEWTNRQASDAGMALLRLFGEQIEPVLERLNRIPEKAFVEFLNLAGVQPLPARPAEALLEFTVSDSSTQSVLVAAGFQVTAPPATGRGEQVVFETQRDLLAAPAVIKEIQIQVDNLFQPHDPGATGAAANFLPFGATPGHRRALFLGLSGNVVPGPTLALGIRVASPPGAPPPIPSGGVAPLPVPPAPQLEWSVLDGASFEPAEIVIDETGGLVHSGVVVLQLPRQWRPGRPEPLGAGAALRWLRLRIAFGQYDEPPVLSSVRLNMVRAIAARTIFNEVLQPIPNSRNRRMRLSQTPILSDSLIIEVDDGGFNLATEPEVNAPELFEGDGEPPPPTSKTRRWRQVDDLTPFGPDAEVYTLDPLEGIVTFGDGQHGAPVPQGFRNVRALRYRVGGGRAGAVEAEKITTLLSSAAFITRVSNPWPATGGSDREENAEAMRRGPQEIRSRGRAVTVADYALLARRAPGAEVERAYAVSGFHPVFPGSPIPGVVAVFVVPPDRNEGPPTPDEDTLRAVSVFLSGQAAPAGVEVVAAAPRYHRIRIEAQIVLRSGADSGETVRLALKSLNDYLHPLTGGEEGTGWPFGGVLRQQALIRRLTSVDGLSAVSTLNIIADEVRILACRDFVPEVNSLLWSEVHQIVVQGQNGQEDLR
ncbi:MAG TPA: putative baseplate assembly protein [Blastocatellia bacterium]|nr:putative baseplate assembly protein [Blastocatellia bacterium]